MRPIAVLAVGLLLTVSSGMPAQAAPTFSVPDATLLMPFDVSDIEVITFFTVTNVGEGTVVTFAYYDERGVPIIETTVPLRPSGDTVVVNLTEVVSLDLERNPITKPLDLSGKRGSVVIRGDSDAAQLIGSFTLVHYTTGASYGSSAAGIGPHGSVKPGATLSGSFYSLADLGDAFLMLVAIDPESRKPVTSGVDIEIELARSRRASGANSPATVVASTRLRSAPAATFPSVFDLAADVPPCNQAVDASCSTSLSVRSAAALVGFSGQAVSSFGAGIPLRSSE
jgi:hypothetical protein